MRALFLAEQAEGRSTIDNLLPSDDTRRMIEALENIKNGAKIDVGNSGLAYRFCTARAALERDPISITGDDSIQKRRPIKELLGALQQLGAKTAVKDGVVTVQGPIRSGAIEIDGAASQPVSALLMTTPFCEGRTTITVHNPGEKPFVDLTLFWLSRVGIEVKREGYHRFVVEGNQKIAPIKTEIPADWSAAAFPIVAALITNSTLQIDGLDLDDPQGDKKIVQWLSPHICGNLFVTPGPILGGTIDVNDCIDALPILAVLGCFAKQPLHLINAKIARFKESDRLAAITRELRKMGGHILEFEDSLTIFPSKLHGTKLFSHKDHRIAMALAVAALAAEGPSEIEDTACIAKSFPNFVETFQSVGANIS